MANVTLPGRRVHETDDAVLIHLDDTDEDVWFPLSNVISMHFDGRGVGHIEVTYWIAEKKGLV